VQLAKQTDCWSDHLQRKTAHKGTEVQLPNRGPIGLGQLRKGLGQHEEVVGSLKQESGQWATCLGNGQRVSGNKIFLFAELLASNGKQSDKERGAGSFEG
jgi:hypothetical protein